MKLYSLVMLLSILSLTGISQGVMFENSLTEAFAKAKKEKKLVFIEYYNPDCSVCKRVAKVLASNEVGAFYNANFISCRINNENPDETVFITAKKLLVNGTPTFFFFDTNEKLIHFCGANQETSYYIREGKNALDPSKQAATVAERYKLGERKIASLFLYSQLAQMYQDEKLVTQLANDLYDKIDKNKLGTKESFIILKNCVNDIDNGFFKFWVDHIEIAETFADKSHGLTPTYILGNIITQSLNREESNTWDLEKIQEVKSFIVKTQLNPNPISFLWQKEATLLFKLHKDEEAMRLGNTLLNDSTLTAASAFYILQTLMNLSNDKKNNSQFRSLLDHTKVLIQSNEDQLNYEYTALLLLSKTASKSQLKSSAKELMEKYQKNHMDASAVEKLMR